ncbi:hypothetical protein D030_1689A, partial [Vibrio parahaemolyticus AQ3810]
MENQRS